MAGARIAHRILASALLATLAAASLAAPPSRADTGAANPCERYGLTPLTEYDPQSLPIDVVADYTQATYEPNDVLGDYALAREAMATGQQILWVVLKQTDRLADHTKARADADACAKALFSAGVRTPPVFDPKPETFRANANQLAVINALPISADRRQALEAKLRSGQLFLEGHKNPFNVDKMKQMLAEVIAEEARAGLPPTRSAPGTWTPDFLRAAGRSYLPYSLMPKLLVALARGETDQYFHTDTQDALVDWILAQDHRAVTIDTIFRESYRLNGGDVYLTLLTIENVLSRHWRVANREALSVSQRLAEITNFFGHEDVHFGAWYHFFGIMLFGFVSGELETWTVAITERVGSRIMHHGKGDARQESFANIHGGTLGVFLRRLIDSGDWHDFMTQERHPELTSPDSYLDLDEDFSQRLSRLTP